MKYQQIIPSVCFLLLIMCNVSMLMLRRLENESSAQLLHSCIIEKETVLHFFLHDTPGGNNPSAVRVVQVQGISGTFTNDTSLTPFGTVWVVDDPLTEGPHPTSRLIGNSRGVYVSAGQNDLMLVAYLDFGFTSGEFKGSSISMVSRNPVTDVQREFAVVGGRGKFRMARGFALLKCIFYNETNGNSIVEYNVVIRHY